MNRNTFIQDAHDCLKLILSRNEIDGVEKIRKIGHGIIIAEARKEELDSFVSYLKYVLYDSDQWTGELPDSRRCRLPIEARERQISDSHKIGVFLFHPSWELDEIFAACHIIFKSVNANAEIYSQPVKMDVPPELKKKN